MRLFSVPADFQESTIDKYHELNSRYENAKVEETYGQITGGLLTGSGRGSCKLPNANLTSLAHYISYSADHGIEFNYTFNASCLGNIEFTKSGFESVNHFLGSLWDAGVRRLTVTLPQLILLVQDSGYPFEIKLSTICQVNSPDKAAFWKRQGIDRIVIDEDITRDFRRIRQISQIVGDGVEIIANSACLKNCPYKMFHYNHESHFPIVNQDEQKFYERRCFLNKADDWTNPIRLNWIRPEDLGYYESVGVRRFKIQGRQAVLEGDPLRTVEAYMRGSYSGDLFGLINMFMPYIAKNTYQPYVDNSKLEGFIAPFYNDPNHCTGDCDKCGYCEAFAELSIDRASAEEMRMRTLKNMGSYQFFSACRNKVPSQTFARRVMQKARKVIGV